MFDKTFLYTAYADDTIFFLNLMQDGLFRGCSRMGGGRPHVPKICHTYPTMMKLGILILYAKKIQKIYESCDTAPEFC